VIDFDVHHGNGTAEAFKDDPRVLMASFYQHPFYPYTDPDTGEVSTLTPCPASDMGSAPGGVSNAGDPTCIVYGAGVQNPALAKIVPGTKMTPREIQVERANRLCNFIGSFRPIALLPKGVVFTWVDLAPRLITVTHHDSIMGPYHRNGEQIADTMLAFRGSADQARQIFAKYHSDYLLTCPDSSTTTIFMSEAPKGFYGQLERGQVPKWLTPIQLPASSPFKIWKISR